MNVPRAARAAAVLALALQATALTAQSSGTFQLTGLMAAPRYRHTATLLQDGQVLIVGGGQPVTEHLTSAELYDPATGTFRLTGVLHAARTGHSATLLPNGKVLIAGGSEMLGPGDARLNHTAELYDPSTGTFSLTGSMSFPRYGHSATLLNNGNVFITGGGPGQAELYDPDTGAFTLAGPYFGARFQCEIACFPAALLPNGNVFLGGMNPAQIYEPRTNSFVAAPGLSDLSTATLLVNGKVLLAGGTRLNSLFDGPFYDGDFLASVAEAKLYDDRSNAFESTLAMTTERVSHTVTLLGDGAVLVTGGWRNACYSGGCWIIAEDARAEVRDPVTGTFASTGSMNSQRADHTATLLNDGRVLVTGGAIQSPAELFTPANVLPPPALLYLLGAGGGQGAVLHAGTARIASMGDPARAGDYLEIYWKGLLDGAVIPPQVAIGGRMAEVVYFGKAPGYEGLSQVNVRVPAGVAPGGGVSVRMTYLGRITNEVQIGVR